MGHGDSRKTTLVGAACVRAIAACILVAVVAFCCGCSQQATGEDAGPIAFSPSPGCYKQGSITLELTSETAGEIHYTLDGSTPDESSALYEGPITLEDRTPEPSIIFSAEASESMVAVGTAPIDDPGLPKANIVRAVCIAEDGETSPVVTGSYFVGQNLKKLYGDAPVISIVTDPANLLDYETGILVKGRIYDEWIKTEGAEAILSDASKHEFIEANYSQKGKDWERPASFEVFSGGKFGCVFDGGIRVKGGLSRVYGQRSFNVYLRDDYGQATLDYPLIPAVVGFDGEVASGYSTFTLRNGGNDTQYLKFRDAFMQSLVADRAFSTQPTDLAIVFLNGEYAGPYNLQEKIDAEFYARHYGVDVDNVVVIKEGELEEGEDDDFRLYEDLVSYEDRDLGDPATWESFKAEMDVESMAEYFATEIYIGNADWEQGKNTMLWRTLDASGESPFADGRWRWSLYDTDVSAGLYDWESLESGWDSLEGAIQLHPLFESALHNEEFRALFTEKLQDIGNTCFDSEHVNAALDGFADKWQPYMEDYYRRFGDSSWAWDQGLDSIRSYFGSRYDNMTRFAEADLAAYE